MTHAEHAPEPNPVWVSFFEEALRLAALARSRRVARTNGTTNEAPVKVGEHTLKTSAGAMTSERT